MENTNDSEKHSMESTQYSNGKVELDGKNETPNKKAKINSTTTNDSTKTNIKRIDFPLNVKPVSIDIGGSFTKVAYWRPPSPPDLPSYIIKEFQNGQPRLPLKPDPSLRVSITEHPLEGSLKFLKFPSNRTVEFIDFLEETNLHLQYGPDKTKVVNATGGGSYKYSDVVKERLGITLNQKDEMKCLVRGLNFFLLQVDNEAFTYDWNNDTQEFISGVQQQKEDPHFPFPYLLVNIGSGVSVLRVDNDHSFERVSGTSLGGGTFWGLAKMLTDIKSFDDVRELSKRGDNKNVDLLVGDIYGSDYHSLGLKSDVIASSFGKVATKREDLPQTEYRTEDVVRSLLFMISNNIAQIGYLNAKLCGVKRIFFSGGFLQDNSYVWSRLSYGVNFWSKGEMRAMFLLHNSYLGCLGALLSGQSNNGEDSTPSEESKKK